MKKLLYLVANDTYFCTHRINLALAAQKAGFTVALATEVSTHQKRIEQLGITVFPLRYFHRSSLNPFKQILGLYEIYKIYKFYKPDVVHQVALKPVVFGTLVANWLKVPKIINALGGLGYLFTDNSNTSSFKACKKSFLRKLVSILLAYIFSRKNTHLILQNQDDLKTLQDHHVLNNDSTVSIIAGSGIDLNAFPVSPFPPEPPIRIVCVSRMLWDKGIGELVEATQILKTQLASNTPIQVCLYGLPDPQNPASIPQKTLEGWNKSGIVEWKGYSNDTASVYANCHIAVLPSYREGLPKSLLEAASCGRPIVTTDVPGCQDIVKNSKNGFLVPAKDSQALAEALSVPIKNKELRTQMGITGRTIVENTFSEEIIHPMILKLYDFVGRN